MLNLNDDIVGIIVKVFLGVITSCFAVEITPIKINPISWFCKRISKNVNKERDEKIDNIEKTLKEHIEQNDKYEALSARTNIIRFAEDLKMKKIPSEEHFDIILDDINFYEAYCTKHPEFPNNKCVLAIKFIKESYEKYYLNNVS